MQGIFNANLTHQVERDPDPPGGLTDRLRGIRHVALDMDGTIYRGGTLFNFTNPFLEQLKLLGIGFSFLTNNSSKSARDYLAHLRRLGVEVGEHQLFTSLHASIEYLREELPAARRLFVLGTASAVVELEEAGFEIAADDPADAPDVVLVGFDTELTFARLCRAAYWIQRGKPFLATHPDLVCPTDAPTLLVDCGALCAGLTAATGRSPLAVLGKPDPRMLRALMHRLELQPQELAMVGDRLYTDVAMARRAGALGVLVLTGEATALDAADQKPPPDLVLSNLAELGQRLAAAKSGKGP